MTISTAFARRRALCAAAGLLGCGLGAAATAQTSTNVSVLEEVVVTAQKFEQKLSETPLSVTAISARNLEALGATQFRDFASTVPGLNFTTSGVGSTQVNLRGITTGNNISPTVGIYVDEVPYGSSTPFASGAQLALDVGLFDVSRIEILRGPQGTLYGASTMGGLLKYVSVTPDTSAFGGTVRAGLSSTAGGGVGYDAAAALNAPFADDKAALRVSGFYTHDSGFVDNLASGRDDVNEADVYGGRADLLLKPADRFTLRFTAFAQDIERDGTASSDFGLTTGAPIDGDLDQRRLRAEPFDQQFRLGSATLSYEFESATLTSISSYQTVRSHAITDVSAFFVPVLAANGIVLGSIDVEKQNDTDKFTQEVRLNASGTLLDWSIGAFYTDEDSDQFQTLNSSLPDGTVFPVNLLTVELPSTYEEYAGFGTLTWHVTPKLDLTGGLRYAHNSQRFEQIGSGPLVFSVPERGQTDSIVTYQGTISYRASERVMPYLRYATGYRPGGPNAVINDLSGQPLADPTFDADKLRSYEAGIKTSSEDRRFSVDAAVYFIDWDNLQINAVRNGLGVVDNAAAAESKGAELTLTLAPTSQLTLVAALGYTDAELSEDAPDLGGANGDRLPDTPKFTGSLSADYGFDLGSRDAFVGTTVRHVSDRVASYDDSASVPQYDLPEYTTVDLRAGLQLGAARLQLYAKNAFDERGKLSATTGFSAAGGPAWVSLVQPRTIGLNVITQF
ncbi:MAG TPA: TonB-dependent receptor [Steroidobacteraceae bacterium]|jgi:outer membrane receptor protein involved in Fe transport